MERQYIFNKVNSALQKQATVALIGPRQVGKTTLALDIAETLPSLYLDLESPGDRGKLSDAELFLQQYEDRLVILDEIHRVPELFQTLRGLIDRGRRKGFRTSRFLILGSASIDLLRQSGESLAGRISYINMQPFGIHEVAHIDNALSRLWVRGGFPDSFLSDSDSDSMQWRLNFIRTYLERDVPQLGPRIPAETLQRLWTMLAHLQGSLLNASNLAASLAVSAPTINSYIDLMVDLLLVRRLRPYARNAGKRLVKSPRVYVRDSGLVHALLGINDFNELFGHPVAGMSWEGFVIETLISAAPERTQASFYRTSAGAEIDLVLQFPGNSGCWAIEIKKGLSVKLTKGFHHARQDIKPAQSFVVYSGNDRYPLSNDVEVISLPELTQELINLASG